MVLSCRVCGQKFAKFDQRGYSNSGFTQHQNRCIDIERRKKEKTQDVIPHKPTRRRLAPMPKARSPSQMIVCPLVTQNFLDAYAQFIGPIITTPPPPFIPMTMPLPNPQQQTQIPLEPLEQEPAQHCEFCITETDAHGPFCPFLSFSNNQDPSFY